MYSGSLGGVDKLEDGQEESAWPGWRALPYQTATTREHGANCSGSIQNALNGLDCPRVVEEGQLVIFSIREGCF